MPAQVSTYATSSIVSATPTFNAVVIIATIGPVHVDNYGSNVRLEAMVAFTPGADTSAITLELRRNSITGTQLGTDATFTAVAATPGIYNCSGQGAEPVGNHTYNLCITQTGASAAGTVGAVTLYATVGN